MGGWSKRVGLGTGLGVVGLCLVLSSGPARAEWQGLEQLDRDVVTQIDRLIRLGWEDAGVRPSREATDGQWCRRVYLDLVGRIPTVDELQAYLQLGQRGRQRRAKLVVQLLDDARYGDDYRRYWTGWWTNLLIGRSGGTGTDRMVSREGLESYLQECLEQNRRYDQMVHQLLVARGTNTPGSPGFNGAVNFLTAKLQDDATQATADTARIFLGLQVQCTQCHNHPFNDWKQDQFWSLNSFFRQAVALRRFDSQSGYVRMVELADQDFAGENRRFRTPERAEVYYELRNGDLRAAYPRFVDGTAIDPSGYVEDVVRRHELADLITSSDYLSRGLVNRMWAHFLGYGFTRPVDDMGPHNPPSHPDLLDYLADQFRSADYDLKRLMLWVTLSEAYSLSSQQTRSNAQDDPTLGDSPLFSRFYLRQMRAEELYQSLLVATQADQAEEDAQAQQEARRRWLSQFVIAFGTDEGDEISTFDGTIPQTLMMFNGPLVRQATRAGGNTFLGRVARDGTLPSTEKVQRLYLAALARPATRGELNLFSQLVTARQGQVEQALEDLWWALLNSNEFILNH